MDMLWLAGLMGLLAACAFTFLWYMAFRRLRQRYFASASAESDAEADDAEQSDVALAESSEDAHDTEFDTAVEPDTNDDAFLDPMILSEDYASAEEEEFDVHAFHTSAWDAFDEVDEGTGERGDVEAVDEVSDPVLAIVSSEVAISETDEETDESMPGLTDVAARVAETGDNDRSAPVNAETAADEDDWIAAATAPEQFDEFDPQSDEFVVVWDDAAGQEPIVQVRRCDGDPALSDILLDDVVVARFRSKADVDADQLTLVPLSTARAIGWAHA